MIEIKKKKKKKKKTTYNKKWTRSRSKFSIPQYNKLPNLQSLKICFKTDKLKKRKKKQQKKKKTKKKNKKKTMRLRIAVVKTTNQSVHISKLWKIFLTVQFLRSCDIKESRKT